MGLRAMSIKPNKMVKFLVFMALCVFVCGRFEGLICGKHQQKADLKAKFVCKVTLFARCFCNFVANLGITIIGRTRLEPQISPYKTLIFLSVVLIVLLIPSFFVPDDWQGWPRYPSFSRVEELLSLSSPVVVVPDTIATPDTMLLADVPVVKDSAVRHADSVSAKPDSLVDTRPIVPAASVHVPIEYLGNTHALDAFWGALARGEHRSRPVGVLHYADSQAENDLITSTIRDMLQSRFGGAGIGLVHPGNRTPNLIGQRCSQGWRFHSVHGGSSNSRYYGIFGGLSELQGATDSDGEWVRFVGREVNRRGAKYNRLRLLLGHNVQPYWVRCSIDGDVVDSVLVEPGKALNAITLGAKSGHGRVEVNLQGDGPMHAYGLLQESSAGIYVHNIPVRGSSGTFFGQFDEGVASAAMSAINVRLIIVQYGINAVPSSITNYKFYENSMASQLRALKRMRPEASIVLVGVSDMSQKTPSGYASHPNVARVRAAQRRAAQLAGVAFWDCYSAMGGDNSMSTWALSSPPLGQKDFTHFTSRGARLIAQRLTNALLSTKPANVSK